MARAKDRARRLADEETQRRRQSAAHRSLRRRAEKRAAARETADADVAADEGVQFDAGQSSSADAAVVDDAPDEVRDDAGAEAPVGDDDRPGDDLAEEMPDRGEDVDAGAGSDGEDARDSDDDVSALGAAAAGATAAGAVAHGADAIVDDGDAEGDSEAADSDAAAGADAAEAEAEGDEADDAALDAGAREAAPSEDVAPEPSGAPVDDVEPDEGLEPGDAAESADDGAGEPDVDRVPTSELRAPAWLAAGAAATAGSREGECGPAGRLASTPGDDDEPVDEAGAAEPETDASSADAVAPEASAIEDSAGDDIPPSDVGRDGPTGAADDDTVTLEPVTERTAVMPPFVATASEPSPPSGPAATDAAATDAAATGGVTTDAATADGTGPAATATDDHGPSRRRRAAWLVPLVLAVIAVLYVGAQALLSASVPRATQTLGVSIGGMSETEAEGAVQARADELESAELMLRAAEQTFALPAHDAGLAIDAEATVAQVTGFTLAPERLWQHVVGGGSIEPVTTVDEELLADALETTAVQLDGPAQDAGVTVSGDAVEVVPGRSAVTVDQEASAALVVAAWPDSRTVDLVAETESPAVTDEDAQTFAAELEGQTFAAPITLVGDEAEATIEPATLAAVSTVETGPAGLELTVDGPALAEEIIAANPELTTDGENASVSFDDDHEIVIDEGRPGITIDGEALGAQALAAADSADRLGELPYTAADPEVSAEDLGLADFQQIVASFDTPLTAERIRTQNLRTAAADVEGVILQPGDTFDLTEVLSPITEEEGYQPAHVIVNGILTNGMGGGLSQMATTSYNAAYFAGYELIDHRPHSVWFTRYPAGRESTIYTGSINVVFKNTTPYAAIFNSYVDGGRLHVDIWSTEHFEVTTSASPKTNVVQPGTKEVTAANCEAKGKGQPGFTITNTRTVYLDGEQVDRNVDTWTYKPDDAIKCVKPEDVDDEDDG